MEEKKEEKTVQKIVQCGLSKKGAKQWQEDSFFYMTSESGKVIIGGVFDGHGGYNGLIASTTARDYAKNYFEENKTDCEEWTLEEWKTVIFQLFEDMHNTIREKFLKDRSGSDSLQRKSNRYRDGDIVRAPPRGDPIHGGSTGTLIIQVNNSDGTFTIISANVGDSTGIMIPRKDAKRGWKMLTVDHGPENQDEWNRINALPKKDYPHKLLFVYDKTTVLRKYECPLVFLSDGSKDQKYVANPWGNGLHPTNVRYEPAVYAVSPRKVTKDSTCIAMTRALGDFYAHQFGLSAIPSFQHFEMDGKSPFTICLASDGIWDCWKYEDFGEYMNDQHTAFKDSVPKVGEKVLNESISRAISNFGQKYYDDAALVMWYTPVTEKEKK